MAAVTLYVPKVASRSSNIVLPIDSNEEAVRVLVVGRLDGKKRGLGGKKWMDKKTLRANYLTEQYTSDIDDLAAEYSSSVIIVDGHSYLPVALLRHRQQQPETTPQSAPPQPDLFNSASTARIEDLLTQILEEMRVQTGIMNQQNDRWEKAMDEYEEVVSDPQKVVATLNFPSLEHQALSKSAGIELVEVVGSPIGNNGLVD